MKRRSKSHRQRPSSNGRQPLGVFSRAKRKRKTFTFEHLEDRLAFSVAPLELQTVSLSNDTPEGTAAMLLRELQWAAYQTANATELPEYTFLALPSDPMFPFQWHLLNTGQEVGNPDFERLFGVAGEDINVVPAWNMGYTGEGVVVAVLDSGIQLTHPDLVGNIHPTLRFNASTGGTNASPSLIDPVGFHGTAVAGLIGATWNNLAAPLVDSSGDPVLDRDGNPVLSGGGVGVAPNVTLVPIKLNVSPNDLPAPFQFQNAFQFVIQNDIDITNNSWGPDHRFNRLATPMTPEELQILRDSVIFGRDGLGIIHVFASGNDAGNSFNQGFEDFGNYDSASYNAWVNSRYTIGVTGVSHTGQYMSDDGTIFNYSNAGSSVLVAAPTGSNHFALNIAEDNGQGSGLWTTDLVDDFGINAAPLPSGFDPDRDLWPDPDYTSRFNGTSAAAPLVTGVIALMLEANPNLTYRDVQEILVRSARQNAQFEFPSTGGEQFTRNNTWVTNQTGIFRDPDSWQPFPDGIPIPANPSEAIRDPIADFSEFRHFEAQPDMVTNGAGYTVSQGYGVYGEQIGYAHGVVDAELALKMAEQWHALGQNLDPFTERSFTTFVFHPGTAGLELPPAERMSLDNGGMLVPGGIGGEPGFIGFWEEYFVELEFDDETGELTGGPFAGDDPPVNSRGRSFIEFSVPDDRAINIEWVEVKFSIEGATPGLDSLRLMLMSPDGTFSELHNWYVDPGVPSPHSIQPGTGWSGSGWLVDPAGGMNPGVGNFVWTFSSNRHWGESSADAVIIDPITGEPMLQTGFAFDPGTGELIDIDGQAATRGWRIYIENWGTDGMVLDGLEVVWHGKPMAEGAQRVQGFVGTDTNNDEQFNYNRYNQLYVGDDPLEIRAQDVIRILDLEQEPFAENILVEAFRVVDGVTDNVPTARFLTGDDGNYYFDLLPDEYVIRITDPLNRILLDDLETGPGFLAHYQSEWHITEDWFFAPEREDLTLDPARFGEPGEVLFDDVLGAPVQFVDGFGLPVPAPVKNLNFLLKDTAPVNEFIVTGSVYADINGNGRFDGDDAPLPGVFVYWDVNRNGNPDAGEPRLMTDADGEYSITIPASAMGTFQVGVIQPTPEWLFTDPGQDGVEIVFAGPGLPPQIVNFFLDPPSDPGGGDGTLGSIHGVVFSDVNENGFRDVGESGLSNIRVFIDANENGVWDSATEAAVLTASNGSYFFGDLPQGLYQIDVYIPNEGTADAAWALTAPPAGFRQVNLGAGGTALGINFGLDNRADRDWGDLPNSYLTSAAVNGPSHTFIQGFRLGTTVDGEINGVPSPAADSDDSVGDTDDGVRIVSNGGFLQPGLNILEVTVFGFGGVLTGWIDWDKNGQFDAADRIVWRDSSGSVLGDEADLVQGTYTLQVIAPANMMAGPLAARFRWGEPGLDFFGPALIGEVEDYFLPAMTVPISGVAGDYNNSGTVDIADYIVWRKNLNTNTTLPNDTTPGMVTQADYDVWQNNIGMTAPGAGGGSNEPALPLAAASQQSSTTDPSAVEVSVSAGPSVQVKAAVHSSADAAADSAPSATSLVDFGPAISSSTSFVSTASVVQSGAVADSGSDADLLLLDQVLAELADSAEEAPLADRFRQDEDGVGELELAVAFEDESNWWSI